LTKKTTFVRLFSNKDKRASGPTFGYFLPEPSGEGKFFRLPFGIQKDICQKKGGEGE
jgi:hypothetical protein